MWGRRKGGVKSLRAQVEDEHGIELKQPELICAELIAPRCLKRWYAVSTKHALRSVAMVRSKRKNRIK